MEERTQRDEVFRVKKKIIPAGAVAHIIQRAPGKEVLFLEEADYLYFLKLLKETAEKYSIEVFCFVLMTNHIHFLARFNTGTAPEAIKNLCERYAWYFNIKYKRKGHVFYGAYRASLCLDDSYLLTSSLYIHLNPVKARLAAHPALYRWSSCHLYTELVDVQTFIDYHFILSTVHNDIEEARKIYKDLLDESATYKVASALEDPHTLVKMRRYLLSTYANISSYLVGQDEILDNRALEKTIDELKGAKKLRNPQKRKARQYLVEQLLSRGYQVDEIADKLSISKRTAYRIITSIPT